MVLVLLHVPIFAATTGRALEVNLRNNKLTGSLPIALSQLPIAVCACCSWALMRWTFILSI